MSDPDVLVVGGGPAGLAAAARIAAKGHAVTLVEQRPSLGGAYHRQPAGDATPLPLPASAGTRWRRLVDAVAASGVTIRTRCAFLGLDGDGVLMIEDRASGRVERLRARAVVSAVGAMESVRPRPGWHLPGVTTAGGLQVMMKETGRAPRGRVLIAGNGPLTVALGAQMARAGNPPVAVLETADPFRHGLAGLGLLAHPRYIGEALDNVGRLVLAGVRWRLATRLVRIDADGDRLIATIHDRRGRIEELRVDRIALHDGVRLNDFGLPAPHEARDGAPFVVHAGDCREVLGVVAAEADGHDAGDRVLAALAGRPVASGGARTVVRERRAQAILARLFAPAVADEPIEALPPDTVLCRCEGRTVGDLHALLADADGLSGREIKHNGRFAMGACQGRFCAHWVAEAAARLAPEATAPSPRDLTGRRWPIRPVSIAALAASSDPSSDR